MENGKEIDCGEMIPAENRGSVNSNLIALAIEKGASVEAIKELQLMQERWEDRKAKQAFAADFVEMKSELPKVLRNKLNGQTKSKYAPLEDINTQVDPVLKKFGFATKTRVEKQDADTVTVVAELWHRNGHTETTTVVMPIDDKGMNGTPNKTKIHGISSTITYAKRIGICALLNISTGDDQDGNLPGDQKNLVEEKTVAEMKQLLEDKWERLTGEEQNGVNRVIKNKEVKSYAKTLNFLRNK